MDRQSSVPADPSHQAPHRASNRLGDFVSFGTGALATLTALLLSVMAVALTKLVYRPLITGVLILFAGIGLVTSAVFNRPERDSHA